MAISGKHVAAARQFLDMSQLQLAQAAGVSDETIMRWETGQTIPRRETVAKIQAALERRGIEFYNSGEPGVRLRPSKAVIPS